MPYHVWVGASRYVVEQDILLQDFLSKLDPNQMIVVKAYDYLERQTMLFGSLIPGALPLPSSPGKVVENSFVIQHLTTQGSPL